MLVNQAFATHIVGGEIFYDCLGPAQGGGYTFEITLKVYRDCGPSNSNNTPFDNPAHISVYDSQGTLRNTFNISFPGSTNVPVILNNPCLAAPPQVCVEEAIYKTTQVMQVPPGGLDLVYQRCCRNPTIINIVNPGTFGSTYAAHIPDNFICNSSPYFKQFPPIALCVGEQINFDHSAIDPNGDSLVYKLCRPYHGASSGNPKPNPPLAGPWPNIQWAPGYSDNNQMDANPIMSIHPQTGLLTGVPTKVGQFVVGVCVEEWRNGVLIGENKRDFQFNVVNCNMNVISAIANQTVFCDGLTVQFSNNSNNGKYYFWDFGDPNDPNDTSSAFAPQWTYTDTGVFTIMMIVNKGWPCADTAYSTFAVYPLLKADFDPPADQCLNGNSFNFQAGGIYDAGNCQFLWDFGPTAAPATSNLENPSGISYGSPGWHKVKLTIFENNCQRVHEDSVRVWPEPELDFVAPPTIGCPPLTVQFTSNSTAATQILYDWQFGDGGSANVQNPTYTYTEPGTYDVSLTIKTIAGCERTLSGTENQVITVHPTPTADITASPEEVWIFEPYVDLFGTAVGETGCEMHAGDGTIYPGCGTFPHTYKDTGNYYPFYTVINEFGCRDTAWAKVRITPVFLFYAPNTFTPGGDQLNDVWHPKVSAAAEYDLRVYDRWGHVVFQTNQTDVGWNGTMMNSGNKVMNTAVFNYIATIVDVNGENHVYTGRVQLLK